jgi:hypothetical protein
VEHHWRKEYPLVFHWYVKLNVRVVHVSSKHPNPCAFFISLVCLSGTPEDIDDVNRREV